MTDRVTFLFQIVFDNPSRPSIYYVFYCNCVLSTEGQWHAIEGKVMHNIHSTKSTTQQIERRIRYDICWKQVTLVFKRLRKCLPI